MRTYARVGFTTLFNGQPLVALGAISLLLFMGLAAFDGVFLHLLKFRLHARPESYVEHLWHTVSAVLFVPIAAWLFAPGAGGVTLWLGVAALAATHLVEVFDLRSEPESRRGLGGLGRGEVAIHIAAVVTRTGAVAAWLWSLPLHAWSVAFQPVEPRGATGLGVMHSGLLWGAISIAALHVGLALKHCPRRCSCWAAA